MTRSMIFGAAAAMAISLATPAQAMMADPGLNAVASTSVQLARWHHQHYRHHHWYNSYAYVPYRHWHCWTVRERTWGHHWRWVRHCGW